MESERTNRLAWVLAACSVLFFALFSLFISLPRDTRLLLIFCAALASFGSAIVISILESLRRSAAVDKLILTTDVDLDIDLEGAPGETIRRSFGRKEKLTPLLGKLARGRLDITGDEIAQATDSTETSAAIRALVLRLERTINRFTRLSDDVQGVSAQVVDRARYLSRNVEAQTQSTGETAQSVNEIDQSINSVQHSMENLAESAEETSTSVLEMSASIEEVRRISDKLADFVSETASAIDEMAVSIDNVATNTETFSSFATQTASSMVEMNATTESIATSARQSSDLAESVMKAAREGSNAVDGTVQGMRAIEKTVTEAKDALEDLGSRSEEIGEIVRVIDEIARQTNLLALNAAIIAAQAGDQGRGFAVVADEIRDLSERTSRSTDEIRNLIHNVQRGVTRAVAQMNQSSDRVSRGVKLTEQAESVLARIQELTTESTSSIQAIAKATEEQIRGSQATTDAIEEVTKMVQQTAVATQQQAHTSQKVGEQASVVLDHMKHLQRALIEQESGSRAIGEAMENIMSAVSSVRDATTTLTTESARIVDGMSFVEEGARENSFAVGDLFRLANTLRHEANLLGGELGAFILPEPERGGRITTASVLPHSLTLDPIRCQFMALNYPQKAIHETLVMFGEGAEIVPGIAESWDIHEQGRVYRFQLRKDARFHNGRTVTAEDFRKSLLRLMDPRNESLGAWITATIQGADEVMSGKADDAHGIRVLDTYLLEIHLTEPLAFFIHLMSMPETAALPIDDLDEEQIRLNPIGAGPFSVAESVEGEFIRLSRFDGYWKKQIPYLEEVLIRLDLSSSQEIVDAFMKGELDLAHGIPAKIVKELRDDPEFAPYLLAATTLHTSYLAYDNASPPFDRVEVRQAVSHAINKHRLNERVFSGLGVVAKSLLPPGLLGYEDDIEELRYDAERARELLRKAGHADGFEVDYWAFDTDEFNNSGLLDLIIEDLGDIGIRVNKKMTSREEARDKHTGVGHNTIFMANWYADFPDSDNFFFMFFHSTAKAIPGVNYRSERMDEAIEEARRTLDTERRAQIYSLLNRKAVVEAPVTYLFHDRLFVLHRPKVRGLRLHLAPPPVRYHELWIEGM